MGYSHIWANYRYVSWDRVWFLRFSILIKWGINSAHVGIVFPVGSFNRVPKLNQLK